MPDHLFFNLSIDLLVSLYVYVRRNWSNNQTYISSSQTVFASLPHQTTATEFISSWIIFHPAFIPCVWCQRKSNRSKKRRKAATDAATTKYADPSSAMTSPKLRHDSESRTGQGEI